MKPRHLYLGIDPGIGGAVGIINADGVFHSVHDMPVIVTSTGRKQVDAFVLAELLRKIDPAFTLLERVHARPGEGATGAFSFGHTLGCIQGVLGALALPYDLIQPASWKRTAGIPPAAAKGVSITTAKRLLPEAAPHLNLVKHDGRAESLLLALQAWQTRSHQH